MKVKCGIIYNAFQTIMDFSEKPMPVVLAGKFLRLADELNKENNFIEQQRSQILTKYGDKDENGQLIVENGNVNFKEIKNAEKAQSELNELAEMEVEITDRFITEKDLEEAGLKLTMSQLAALREFLHNEK